MKHIAKDVLLVALAALVGIFGYQAAVLPGRIGRAIDQRAGQAQAAATAIGWYAAWRADQRVGEVTATLKTARADLDRQLATTRFVLWSESTSWRGTVENQSSAAVQQIANIREDLRPVIGEAQETLSQASGTIAVLRPQALGLVAAAKVTAGETAQTMKTVRDGAPKLVAAAVKNGENVAGITADVHTLTTEVAKPKRWWQKLLGPVYTIGRTVAAFL